MSNLASPRDRVPSGRPSPKRSKKAGTIATWRTDRSLKIVGAVCDPAAPLRGLPQVGKVLQGNGRGKGLVLLDPHLRALKGISSGYDVHLSRRICRVEVRPRLGRNGKIIGVRATLTGPSKAPKSEWPPGLLDESELLRRIVYHRQKNSIKSALRSLELAKAVADTARMNAELRQVRALAEQERAEKALMRAEAEERRSRFLADASAVLDTSFEFHETINRLAALITLRIADWCVVQFREEKLRRIALHHRNAEGAALLEKAFPETEEEGGGEESNFLHGSKAVRLAHPQAYTTITLEDLARLAQAPSGFAALKKLRIQSVLQTPIRAHGRTVGLLTIGSDDPLRLYDLQDLQMARSLSYRIGLAHESSVLYAEAQREIAMRKQAEERMRAFNADLERRVRERTSLLEEATREANSFAYTVAHDLRAPLRAITGFCQALKEDYSAGLDAVAQDYLDRIVTGSRRMDDLIRDLLDYARVNRAEINRSIMDLDQVFDAVMESMASELQDRKAVVRRTRPLGRVMAHEPMLQQVITNLISNGAKFVPRGATPQIDVWSEVREGRLRLNMKDNGIGIAPEHQDRIFGIFERLNRAEDYPGTGIGLAIVRRAVERLGGSVGLESTPEKGSTFWIELPTS